MKKIRTLTIKYLFLVSVLLTSLGGSAFAQVPVITDFSPKQGPVISTAVTITGTNFDATAANNIVFFGATQATVTTASPTSLNVTVPAGATYAPITVLNTTTHRLGASNLSFMPTFSPSKANITTHDFMPRVDIATGTNPYGVAIGDIDGDGKADIVVANNSSQTISVYLNTASSGTIDAGSFAPAVPISTTAVPVGYPSYLALGDLDNDGKLDLAFMNSSYFSVLRNTSTTGTVSFAARVNFPPTNAPYGLAIGDLDGDGKADVAVANQGGSSISVFRNTTTAPGGTISFGTKVDFSSGNRPIMPAIGDLDGDGKAEIAVTRINNGSGVDVYQNTSSPGSLTTTSFNAFVEFTTTSAPNWLTIADLDGDGKLDLITANYIGGTVSVLRNTTTSGSSFDAGSFATKVDFAAGGSPGGLPVSIAVSDFDGDGKPDLAISNSSGSAGTISVLRNTSSPGSIDAGAFATKVDFATGPGGSNGGTRYMAAGDLDGDGRPDLVVTNYSANTLSILRNNPIISTVTDISPTSGCANTTPITITGTNLSAVTGITIGGTNVASFSVVSDNSIQAIAGSGTTGVITVSGPDGFVSSTGSFTVNPLPTTTITADPSLTITQGQSATLAASGATSYSWSTGETTATISVSVAGPYSVTGVTGGCSATATASLTVSPAPPSITSQPVGPANICFGGSVSIPVGVTNVTSFQWLKGTTPSSAQTAVTGQTSATLTLTNLQPTDTGYYSLSVTGPGGSTVSNGFSLMPITPPLAFVAANPSLTITQGQSATLTASGATSFLWSTGDTSPAISVSVAGPYSVTVSANGSGCFGTKTVTVSVTAPACGAGLSGPIWTGCVSTDWNTAGNWASGAIPTATDDVVIPSAPANQPVLSTTATAKSVEVQTGASLSITAAGSLTINGSKSVSGNVTAFHNGGTVANNGQLIVGNTAAVGDYGIFNVVTFINNAGGTISIDRTTVVGLENNIGSFTNSGTMRVGAVASVGNYGIDNRATFTNNAGGAISIDQVTVGGLLNFRGSFTNSATITIGASASVGATGVDNRATFANTGCDALINIVADAIINNNGTFTNTGTIIENATGNSSISTNAGLVQNLNGGTFNIGTNTGVLTTTPGPQPTITPSPSLTINQGQSATLTASGATSYSWSSGQSTSAISVSVAGPYSVTGTIGSCASVATVTLTVNALACGAGLSGPIWTGCLSTDWNTASNWASGTVPVATDDVVIPSAPANQPVLSTTATAKSVEVQSGASLSITAAGSLTINDSRGITRSGFTYATSFYNEGTVISAGQLVLGNLAPVGVFAIWNNGTFTNNGGNIRIDRTTNQGIDNGGTFANTGTITIGALASVGANGIWNQATFNNTGGIITIDQTTSHGLHNTGTFTNSATILVGQSGTIGQTPLNNTGTASFTNNATGLIQLKVYNESWDGIDNYGTYVNSGTITVVSSASVNVAGIYSEKNFTNTTTGIIRVNQAPYGVYNYYNGVFTNAGTITLALSATAGQAGSGLQNYNRFTNQSTGVIYIDGYQGNGIWNTQDATTNFQNSGLIRIGANARTGVTGILNYRTFSNNSGGQIEIDQPKGSAIVNNSPTAIFTNAATIRIGQNFAIPGSGIDNGGSATFNNLAGASITIDRTGYGLTNLTSSTFVNAALVEISTTGPASTTNGIWNTSMFSNSTCAVLTVFDNINNGGPFTNEGLFTVNTTKPHTNTGTLTNNGIIDYPQGNPIPNVVNNDVIASAISSCSNTFNPALQLGGSSNQFSIGTTWYTDQALTQPAGTYNQGSNTFTATNLAPGSSTLLYFAATDQANGCTKTVSVSVNSATTISISIAANPSLTVTQGNSTTLTASGATSYSWSTGESTAAISVSVAGPYSVTGTTGGCSSETSVVVSITAASLTLADFSANPDPLCVGKVVTFNATVGNLTGSYAYTLTNGSSTTTGTSSNTAFSQSVTTTVSGIQTFSLTVSSNGQSATETYDLTVNAPPIPTLTASNGDGVSTSTLTCEQTTITLNADGGDEGETFSYLFSGPSILNQDPENGRAVVNAAGVYSVTVTNTETGCFSTTSTTVSSNTTAPSVSISPSSATLTCASPSVSLSVIGSGTIAWSTGESTASISVSTAATYTVMLTNAGGCSATASVTVSSNQTPPPVSINPSSTTLSNASPSVSLTAVGTGTFRWSTGATTQVISATASGTYSVTLTSPGGCTASASVPVVGSDLTINLDLPQANFAASGTASVGNFVVNVFEVGGLPTSSGNVTITVTVPIGYTLSFAGSLTSINVSGGEHNPVSVDNPQWTVSQSVGTRQLTLTMNSGVFISGGGESSLGFTISRITANSGSVANITVNVKDDLTMGYDSNLNNNVYARIITGL